MRLDASILSPTALGRVAVLMGGESAEREISLRSGNGILQALQRSGVDAFAFDPAQRSLSALVEEHVDRVFLALHGRFGEDGTVQGALEWLKIPYTGSGVMASAIAMDKAITKRIWSTHGIPTPRFSQLDASFNADELIKDLGLPLAIKPSREGSSIGFSKVVSKDQLQAAFSQARQFDPEVIAEEFVSGREFTCALLDLDKPGQATALPVIEIVAPEGNYDFQNKYFGDATKYVCPAVLDSSVASLIQSLSIRAYQSLGCEGWARVDILWNGKDSPVLLEINTTPGMTDHSLVPMAAAQAGLSYDALVLRILSGARLKMGANP